jgi:hypothetical protein
MWTWKISRRSNREGARDGINRLPIHRITQIALGLLTLALLAFLLAGIRILAA